MVQAKKTSSHYPVLKPQILRDMTVSKWEVEEVRNRLKSAFKMSESFLDFMSPTFVFVIIINFTSDFMHNLL